MQSHSAIPLRPDTATGTTVSDRSPQPTFTVESALHWLGHDCPDLHRCSAAIGTLRASVWFLRRGPQSRPSAAETRVLVHDMKFGDAAASIRRIIYQIDGCTRRDAIEVRYEPRYLHARDHDAFGGHHATESSG